ncbi:MAG: ATP-binding protein [Dehalococcoidia bacterium]
MNYSYLLPPLIASGFAGILLLVVLLKGRRSHGSRTFSLILMATVLLGVSLFAMRNSPDVDHALSWERVALITGFAIFPCYYYFATSLTGRRINRGILVFSLFSIAGTAGLSLTGLFVQKMQVESYGYAPTMGPGIYFLIAASLLFAGTAFQQLIKSYRNSTKYEERNRLIYIMLALAIPVVGLFLDAIPTIYPLGIFSTIVFCILTTIAIIKYHLFDIHFVIRKGIAYILLSGLVAVPYVVIIFVVSRILDPDSVSMWIHFAILLVLAFTIQPVWRRVQSTVDRLYYRGRYDYLKTLENFGRECADIINIEELCNRLVTLTRAAMGTSGAYLLTYDENKDRLKLAAGSPPAGADEVYLDADSAVVNWLKKHDKPMDANEIEFDRTLAAITGRETKMLTELKAGLLVPFRQAGKMVGILILEPKLNGDPYGADDISLLAVVARQASAAIDNANLYAQALRTERALQEKTSELEQIIYATSHDLKSPLLNIQGFSRELEESLKEISESIQQSSSIDPKVRDRIAHSTGEDIHTALQFILASTSKMDSLLAGLLQLSRLGRTPLDIEEIDMNDLIGSIVNPRSYRLRESDITISVEDLPPCMGDRVQLDQVFSNLIDNAIKFLDPVRPGRIQISGRRTDGEVIYCIEDNGIGISANHQGKIFDIFHQLEPDTSIGEGLGLAIVRRIIERHYGEVHVQSEFGKGSKFFVSLPVDLSSNMIN